MTNFLVYLTSPFHQLSFSFECCVGKDVEGSGRCVF